MLLPVRLLVVDDNAAIHSDFRKVLRPPPAPPPTDAALALFGEPAPLKPGPEFEVDSASHGEEALRMVRSALDAGRPYALAFVDQRMPPGWDGVRTIGELWRADPRLHCVICTAHTDLTWEYMRGELGHEDRLLVLKKPFDAIEVRQMTAALAAKWRLEREHEGILHNLETRVAAEVAGRLRLEEGLRRAQKLDALGRLVASVGHEINNPLAYVLVNVEQALARIEPAAPAAGDLGEARALLRESLEGARRVRDMVRRIRDFAHPSDREAVPVDIARVIDVSMKMVANQLRHRADVSLDVAGAGFAFGEEQQLEQVFVNLLVNAGLAMPERDVARNRVAVRARREGPRVIIEIEDNGCGIAPQYLEHVFEPFFTTRPIGQGTGLGLAVSRQIVTGFGGGLTITSEVGRGTVVRIALRAASERLPVAAPPPEPPPAVQLSGRRILVIDDEPAIGRVVARSLKGHLVETMSDAAAAVARYQASPFDLVICDMMMPVMSGIEVHEALGRLGAEHSRRILFVTGGAFTAAASQFLARTEAPCVDKPFDLRQLRTVVDARLGALALVTAV